MKFTDVLTNAAARDDLKEKFEVVMAIWVLGAFAYKKFHSNSTPVS